MERAVYDRMRTLEQGHWWFQARRQVLGAVLDGLDLPPGARVLEVGCGPGGNLALLSRYGAVEGLEPDEPSRAYAQATAGVPVHSGGLPNDLPFEPGGFDLIAALDVMEHVADDAGTAQALHALLKPGGYLLATVPAYGWMWSRHDALHHHQRRYEGRGFRRLLTGAGFRLRVFSHFNTLLFPLIAGVRLAKKAARIEGGDEEAPPPEWLNAVLRHVFASERWWVARGGLPFGVSLLAVAQRPA